MDKNNGSDQWTQIKKRNNRRQPKTSNNKRDKAFPSTSRSKYQANNSGTNWVKNQHQISNYQSGLEVRTDTQNIYGRNFENRAVSVEELYFEIKNIKKCLELFDKIIWYLNSHKAFFDQHLNNSRRHWAKTNGLLINNSLSKMKSPPYFHMSNKEVIIQNFLICEQKFVDESFGIIKLLLDVGSEYSGSCNLVLKGIIIYLEYLLSDVDTKSHEEIGTVENQLQYGLRMFDTSFRNLENTIKRIDNFFGMDETNYQFTNSDPSIEQIQASFYCKDMKEQISVYTLPIKHRIQLKQQVGPKIEVIKEMIKNMEVTANKLRAAIICKD